MNKKRILIVDDEAGFTRLLQLNLNWTGRYLVRAENSPAGALDAVREFHPDLILLDVMMPGMDGGDLAAHLQRNPSTAGIPIIFVTAAVQKREVTAHHGQIGGLAYLAKPIELEELLHCIEQHLNPAPAAAPRPACALA